MRKQRKRYTPLSCQAAFELTANVVRSTVTLQMESDFSLFGYSCKPNMGVGDEKAA